MIILGITGSIGHGKSSLAEAFAGVEPQSVHLESFEVIAEVINAWQARTPILPGPHDIETLNQWVQLLPDVLTQTVHVSVDPAQLALKLDDISAHSELYEKLFLYLRTGQQHPELLHATISSENKYLYRPLLQWLGGYLVAKVDPGIWYRELMRRTSDAKAQGTKLSTIGGVRYPSDAEIVRTGGGHIIAINRPLLVDQDTRDPTERERKKIKPDSTVVNNAGLSELAACARQIFADLQLGKLHKQYVASDTHK